MCYLWLCLLLLHSPLFVFEWFRLCWKEVNFEAPVLWQNPTVCPRSVSLAVFQICHALVSSSHLNLSFWVSFHHLCVVTYIVHLSVVCALFFCDSFRGSFSGTGSVSSETSFKCLRSVCSCFAMCGFVCVLLQLRVLSHFISHCFSSLASF